MTSDEVRDMSDDDLLDMDYFLHDIYMRILNAKSREARAKERRGA